MPFWKKKGEKIPYHPERVPRCDMPVSLENLQALFADCADFVTRTVYPAGAPGRQVTVCYLDGIVSGELIAEEVIKPIATDPQYKGLPNYAAMAEFMCYAGTYSYSVKRRETMDQVVRDIINGFCTVLFPGLPEALSFEVKGGDKRGISETESEKVVKGARDAFIEILRSNTALVRRKIRNPALKIRELQLGRQSNTTVAVFYIEGLTNAGLVRQVIQRLSAIDIDGALSPGNLEAYMVDNPRSPFPQLPYTERTDRFCLNLLEGRVGIMADGLPLGFLAPGTFTQFLKVPQDRAEHYLVAGSLTVLRYVALLVALFLPAFFVAVTMYHQEMIPAKLLVSIVNAKQLVPFPVAVEVLGMLVAFELLQEAGLRLPNAVGETVSILGALIVGQSAVEAKILSPIVIIVVAVAGLAGYVIPNQDMGGAVRVTRFLLVIAAILGGMYGLFLGAALLVYHLATLESFGVPYMTPFAGKSELSDLSQTLRPPLTKDKYREAALGPENKRNQR